MPAAIDRREAAAIVREAAAATQRGPLDATWLQKLETLSNLCDAGVSKTHIAFFGTALLAKSVNPDVDLFAIKPKHSPGNANAYSARSLCHGVLVPLSAELGINLGVTGREPLNNQPYFRMTRLDDGTPVHTGGRAAFDYMLDLIREVHQQTDSAGARAALCAFIAVRKQHQVRYGDSPSGTSTSPAALCKAIAYLVRHNSEGGRTAQAVVAGLMDVVFGPARVESGRINDPSRKYPGDVCIREAPEQGDWEKAIEVRDKPVTAIDVQIFGKKCADMHVREAAIVMVHDSQETLQVGPLSVWAHELGIGLTIFHGWPSIVNQALFWAAAPKPVSTNNAVAFIHQRLVQVEASPSAISLWHELITRVPTQV